VDALDIPRGSGDRFVAGNLRGQLLHDAEKAVPALHMSLAVVLPEDRSGDDRILHLIPRKHRDSI